MKNTKNPKNPDATEIKYPFSNQLIFALVMEDEQLCKELLERIFQGQHIFFQRMDPQKSLPLGDDSYIIVLNTRCSRKVPESLQALFDYINEGKVSTDDGFIGKIHNEVVALQQDEEVAQIMTMEEEYERRNTAARREGLEQGLEQGRAEGEAAGIAKGEAAATLKLARVMKAKGLDTGAIAEITALSAEEIDKL